MPLVKIIWESREMEGSGGSAMTPSRAPAPQPPKSCRSTQPKSPKLTAAPTPPGPNPPACALFWAVSHCQQPRAYGCRNAPRTDFTSAVRTGDVAGVYGKPARRARMRRSRTSRRIASGVTLNAEDGSQKGRLSGQQGGAALSPRQGCVHSQHVD